MHLVRCFAGFADAPRLQDQKHDGFYLTQAEDCHGVRVFFGSGSLGSNKIPTIIYIYTHIYMYIIIG